MNTKAIKERAWVTTSTLTRDFKHLRLPTKYFGYGANRSQRDPRPGIPVKDRIKFWNIVPGDKVRIVNGPLADKNVVREVASVNKLTNQVFINGLPLKGARKNESRPSPVHYSNLQLLVGEYEVTADNGQPSAVENVFATRLSSSKPFYLKEHRLWTWTRYAAATSIKLPSIDGVPDRKNRIRIPWPIGKKDEKPADAGPYDTVAEDALAVTWSPFHPKTGVDMSTLEARYIQCLHPDKSFFNPKPRSSDPAEAELYNSNEIDPHSPIEQFLAAELSNPHSRAKKQKRWQDRESDKAELKQTFINREMERARKTGPGRELGGKRVTPSEARRIGEWKWKNELIRRATQEKHRRWVLRGGLENQKRRQERSARKLRRQQERLRNLVLSPAKNQVIPGGARN